MELVCDQTEHALAVALGGVAAVAVAPAQLFQLVVQVAHGVGEPDKPRTDLLRTRDAGQLGRSVSSNSMSILLERSPNLTRPPGPS